MTKQEFLALFEEVVEEPAGTVTGSERLREDLAGWNSLAILSFIAMVDDHFGISLSPSKITAAKTVDDLIGLLGDRVSG